MVRPQLNKAATQNDVQLAVLNGEGVPVGYCESCEITETEEGRTETGNERAPPRGQCVK